MFSTALDHFAESTPDRSSWLLKVPGTLLGRAEMREPNGPEATWTPPWIHAVAAAAWVVGPDMRMSYLNQDAERLLGVRASRALDRPCHQVVAGREPSGRPSCRAECPIFEAARRGREVRPKTLRIRRSPGDRWATILMIPTIAPDHSGPWLVHCAIDTTGIARAHGYVTRVASRTPITENERQLKGVDCLTRREREILDLLVRDETLWAISNELHISHATVRNHVQHILSKLGVHSIAQAVALSLIDTT
jgi:DNA-binding CsgD family transcriptional regulator